MESEHIGLPSGAYLNSYSGCREVMVLVCVLVLVIVLEFACVMRLRFHSADEKFASTVMLSTACGSDARLTKENIWKKREGRIL